MIFVILVIVICNILYSDCAPKENKVEIMFPRLIKHESSVIISGTLNVTASTLRTTITGRGLGEKEECIIDIDPQKGVIVIGGHNVTYDFFNRNKDIVPFTFMITAISNQDKRTDSLHVDFDGNKQGMQDLENPCSFKSFSDVEIILFEGFKHIRNLTFLYKDEDGDDDTTLDTLLVAT